MCSLLICAKIFKTLIFFQIKWTWGTFLWENVLPIVRTKDNRDIIIVQNMIYLHLEINLSFPVYSDFLFYTRSCSVSWIFNWNNYYINIFFIFFINVHNNPFTFLEFFWYHRYFILDIFFSIVNCYCWIFVFLQSQSHP